MTAWPGGHGPAARAAGASCGPAARWIAPSTPPPPDRPLFAALTIASTSSVVISATTTSMDGVTSSVVEDERHHHVDLILGDVSVTDVDPLLLDPGTADVAKCFRRPGDAALDGVLEALRRR